MARYEIPADNYSRSSRRAVIVATGFSKVNGAAIPIEGGERQAADKRGMIAAFMRATFSRCSKTPNRLGESGRKPSAPMNPIPMLKDHSSWMDSVGNELSRIDRTSLWVVILATVVSRLTYVVAFLIPIKVILLLGSASVPHYFQSFIAPEQKMLWVAGLSVGAVVFYLISLVADSVSSRFAMYGGEQVEEETGKLAIFKNQSSRVQRYFVRFCRSRANLIVSILLLLVGFVTNLPLFAFLSACLLFQAMTTLTLANRTPPGIIARLVNEKLTVYLSTLSSTNFLLVFGFLLIAFYTGFETNTFIAIVSIVVTRQILASLSSVCTEVAFFAANRSTVNTLLFPQHRHQPSSELESRQLWELFEAETHAEDLARVIGTHAARITPVWRDTGEKNFYSFDIECNSGAKSARYLEHIYPPGNAVGATNESVLFSLMEPASLHAPTIAAEYERGPFLCRLFRLPDGAKRVPPELWKEVRRNTLFQHWDIAPTEALVDRFRRTRHLLDEGLSNSAVAGIELALEGPEDTETYKAFLDVLPTLLERLRMLPLFVLNPKVNPQNCWIDENGLYISTNWANWTIAPVGAGLTSPAAHRRFLEVAAAGLARVGASGALRLEDLIIASHLWELERLISQQSYGAAIPLLRNLLSELEGTSTNHVAAPPLMETPLRGIRG